MHLKRTPPIRDFALASDVKAGDILEADSGFDCLNEGERVEVFADETGYLFVHCNHEDRDSTHYLYPQLGGPRGGFDADTHYVGFYKCDDPAAATPLHLSEGDSS